MNQFTWLAVHSAVAYLHFLLAWRFYPQSKDNFMVFVFWLLMVLSMMLHICYGTANFFGMTAQAELVRAVTLTGYWLLAFLPALLATLFLGELTKKPEKTTRLNNLLAVLSKDPKRLLAGCLLISLVTVLISIVSLVADPEQMVIFGNYYSLAFTFVFAAVWLVMLGLGFRPGLAQGEVATPSFRWLMLGLIALYIIVFLLGSGKVWSLVPIVTTVGLSLCFCWYKFRSQFMDVIIKQFLRILMAVLATLGFVALIEQTNSMSAELQKFIVFVFIIATALSYYWLSTKLASFWHPSSDRLSSIHADLPLMLAKCHQEHAAIDMTEQYLSTLFNSRVAINRSLDKPLHSLLISGEPELNIQLGYLRRWMPWFSEALHWVKTAGIYLQSHLNILQSLEKEHQQQLKAEELTSLAAKAELNAMRSQIRPHFLFNILNSIHSFVTIDPKLAERTIEILSDIMRDVLSMSDKDRVPLEAELKIAENYLLIEKIRYGEQFDYRIELDPSCRGHMIPPFSLQPLVENAIKHAVDAQFEPVHIMVKLVRGKDKIQLQVLDDGPGLGRQSQSAGLGMALKNIQSRLVLLYGNTGELTLENRQDKGTVASISIPLAISASEEAVSK